MLNIFEGMDRSLALKINLRNIFKPLYQDTSIIGYLLGFLFRFFWVIFALIVYFFVFITSVLLYLLWLTIPIYIIYKIFSHG